MWGLRAIIRASQLPGLGPLRAAQVTSAKAPMMNRRRMSGRKSGRYGYRKNSKLLRSQSGWAVRSPDAYVSPRHARARLAAGRRCAAQGSRGATVIE